eukprot:scaffold52728_cov69-Phaeocystis_antarctica.AAC.1
MARPSSTPCRVCYSRCVSNKSLTSGKKPQQVASRSQIYITLDTSRTLTRERKVARVGHDLPARRVEVTDFDGTALVEEQTLRGHNTCHPPLRSAVGVRDGVGAVSGRARAQKCMRNKQPGL